MAWDLTEKEIESVKHLLPESMVLLMQVIGAQATYKLVRRWGGINLPVGMNKTRAGQQLHARLAEEVGEEAAGKISQIYGQQRFLWVPKCQEALRELRNRQIRARLDDLTMRQDALSMPWAVKQLALEYDLTDRQIWYIAKETDIEPDPQMALI